MKQFTAYLIVACLVFLSAPRGLVHDCDHDHSHQHEHVDSDHDVQSEASFEQEDCFSCEFQLDFFEVPQPFIAKQLTPSGFRLTKSVIDRISADDFDCFSLRGPPMI